MKRSKKASMRKANSAYQRAKRELRLAKSHLLRIQGKQKER